MTTNERSRLLGTQEQSHVDVIWWDGDNDEANPMNWAYSTKWSHVLVVSFGTLLV
jgi:hypothetical protein